MTKNEKTFEEALKELEATVKAMESGDLGLDELLAKFESGIGLLRQCEGKLAEAEAKIEVLTKKAVAEDEKPTKKPVKKEAAKKEATKKEAAKEAASPDEEPPFDVLF